MEGKRGLGFIYVNEERESQNTGNGALRESEIEREMRLFYEGIDRLEPEGRRKVES